MLVSQAEKAAPESGQIALEGKKRPLSVLAAKGAFASLAFKVMDLNYKRAPREYCGGG